VDDLGERHLLPAFDQPAQNGARVDLAADRPVAADRPRLSKLGKRERPHGDGLYGLPPPGFVEPVAARKGRLPQPVFDVGGRGFGHS
jgi:hypothetical protein